MVEQRREEFACEGMAYSYCVWSPCERATGVAPFLLLHGFGQNAASWNEVAELLVAKTGGAAYALDFAGHGESRVPDGLRFSSYGMTAVCSCVRAFAQLVANEEGVVPVIVGYSMGGRIALECLVRHGAELPATALILESAGLGPRDEEARFAFEKRNLAWAAQVREQGVEGFMDYWASLPLFASQAKLSAEKRKALRSGRLANDAEALACTFKGTGQHRQAFEGESLEALLAAAAKGLAIAYLAGELDEKYAAVVARVGAADPMQRLVETSVIPGAGHNVHLETPEEYVSNILCFLAKIAQ